MKSKGKSSQEKPAKQVIKDKGSTKRKGKSAHKSSGPEGKSVKSRDNPYPVTHANIPLSCPMPDMTLWNEHPRVYLPIEATGEATCPYCGNKYVLIDSDQNQRYEQHEQ